MHPGFVIYQHILNRVLFYLIYISPLRIDQIPNYISTFFLKSTNLFVTSLDAMFPSSINSCYVILVLCNTRACNIQMFRLTFCFCNDFQTTIFVTRRGAAVTELKDDSSIKRRPADLTVSSQREPKAPKVADAFLSTVYQRMRTCHNPEA